jgi:hypothetical protein
MHARTDGRHAQNGTRQTAAMGSMPSRANKTTVREGWGVCGALANQQQNTKRTNVLAGCGGELLKLVRMLDLNNRRSITIMRMTSLPDMTDRPRNEHAARPNATLVPTIHSCAAFPQAFAVGMRNTVCQTVFLLLSLSLCREGRGGGGESSTPCRALACRLGACPSKFTIPGLAWSGMAATGFEWRP